MGFLTALPVVGKVLEKGLDVVDELVEDKDQANILKTEIKKKMESQAHDERQAIIEEQGRIVSAEAHGESWLQRNWRPLLMLCVIGIIANNYILVPYLGAVFPDYIHVLELPTGLWALLNVGVGGYVGGRSGEKIVQKLKGSM